MGKRPCVRRGFVARWGFILLGSAAGYVFWSGLTLIQKFVLLMPLSWLAGFLGILIMYWRWHTIRILTRGIGTNVIVALLGLPYWLPVAVFYTSPGMRLKTRVA